MSGEMSLAEKLLRSAVLAGCAYEIIALSTRRVPTLSHWCRRYRWFEVLLLASLVFHFHYEHKAIIVPD